MLAPAPALPAGVEIVPGERGFDALRPEWERLYELDARAQFFQSPAWLRGLCASMPGEWHVATVRHDGVLAGLVPFRIAEERRSGILLARRLQFGAQLGDSTGIICAPEHEARVIDALAEAFRGHRSWDELRANDVVDPRLAEVVERIAGPAAPETGRATAIPYITLPGDWEEYLAGWLSKRRREDLRRAMRTLLTLPDLSDRLVTVATFERDFAELMRLRQLRWGGVLEEALEQFGPLMRTLLTEERLWLRVFETGGTPVAIIGGFPDPRKRTFWYYWASFNPDYAKISPGKASFGFAIRHAIEAGFAVFSMTYGDEAFKATFGTEQTSCRDLAVRRPSLRAKLVGGAWRAGVRLKRLGR